eukprot:7386812-Prymnesium_polylepis.1
MKESGVVSVRQPASVAWMLCPGPSGERSTMPKLYLTPPPKFCHDSMPMTMQSPADSGGSGGGAGGEGGGGGGEGMYNVGGGCGAGKKHSFQPAAVDEESEFHSIVPSSGTIPDGPVVPQYLTLLTVSAS